MDVISYSHGFSNFADFLIQFKQKNIGLTVATLDGAELGSEVPGTVTPDEPIPVYMYC